MGKKRKKSGVSMVFLSSILGGMTGIAVLFSAYQSHVVKNCMDIQNKADENWRICASESQELINVSDFLTDEVRQFVVSGNIEHLNNYWTEVSKTQTRESILTSLTDRDLPEEEEQLVSEAKRESDKLILDELRAALLAGQGYGIEEREMPEAVTSAPLSREEEEMSGEQKISCAAHYLFDQDYQEGKKAIREKLESFQKKLSSRMQQNLSEAENNTLKAMVWMQASNIQALLLMVLTTSYFILMVQRPFRGYLREMRHAPRDGALLLKERGSAEIREFAGKVNEIYGDWREKNRELKRISECDQLTGLYTRLTLWRILNDLENEAPKDIGFLMADIDSFKLINENYGHQAGDQVLRQVAELLQKIAGAGGYAGRLGGEEFALVFPDTSKDKLEQTAARLLREVAQMNLNEFLKDSGETSLTVTIGCTLWRGTEKNIEPAVMLHQAELALYRAKREGKNQYCFYQKNQEYFIRAEQWQRQIKEVEAQMLPALERKEFAPWFQPQYEVDTGRLCGVEILARWERNGKEILHPGDFIPLFEKNGFIRKLDLEMFGQACRCLKTWRGQGLAVPRTACNFSRMDFLKGGLAGRLEEIVDLYDIPHELLEIEVTESAMLENEETAIHELDLLHQSGFRIAIDDFGTGYSSLSLLNRLPADLMKIDQSFLRRNMNEVKNVHMLHTLISIGDIMNLKVVCEGVETEEQLALLKGHKEIIAQGYYYSRPMPEKEFEKLLKMEAVI